MRVRFGEFVAVSAVAGLVFAAPGVAHAQGSMLDPTFGTGGTVTTDVGPGDDSANAVVTTANVVVAVGSAMTSPPTTSRITDFAITAYDSAGQLIPAFGGDGIVTTDFGGGDTANAVIIQGNKLLVAGTTTTSAGSDFALARYNANGTLDPTFGNGGKVITDVIGDSDAAYALLGQGDKFVAAGYTLSAGLIDFALVRYNANGTPDYTFGNNGRVVTDFAGNVDEAFGLVAGPNGSVVAAGYATASTEDTDFALARYDTAGNLDPGFGIGGRVTTSFTDSEDVGRAIAGEGNKLVVAGYTNTQNKQDFALARYNANGTLDNTFSGDGKVITDFVHDNDAAWSVVVQPGAITAVGSTTISSRERFGLARYNDQGALDQSWGTSGRTATGFGATWARARDAAVQGDKVVVVGETASSGELVFAVARYRAA
jgi:uncharacterized delta-60 repeat protein